MPPLYPVGKWKQSAIQIRLLGKLLYEKRNENKFTCPTTDWRRFAKEAKTYPNSLAECREQTQQYNSDVLKLQRRNTTEDDDLETKLPGAV